MKNHLLQGMRIRIPLIKENHLHSLPGKYGGSWEISGYPDPEPLSEPKFSGYPGFFRFRIPGIANLGPRYRKEGDGFFRIVGSKNSSDIKTQIKKFSVLRFDSELNHYLLEPSII